MFDLPQEVLSILPSDPYEQLDVARTITAMAVAAQVSKLELETGNLHLSYRGDPESTLHETSARLSRALGEQVWKLLLDVSRLSKGF